MDFKLEEKQSTEETEESSNGCNDEGPKMLWRRDSVI